MEAINSTTVDAQSQPNPDQTGSDRQRKTGQTGSLKNSTHGIAYQLKLIQFEALKSRNTKQKLENAQLDYELSTEVKWAGKLDDNVLNYTENDEKTLYCVQAKSLLDESSPQKGKSGQDIKGSKINCTDLLSGGKNCKAPFYLGKYLYSYVSILKHEKYKELNLTNFFTILCTPRNFQFEDESKGFIKKSILKKYKNVSIKVDKKAFDSKLFPFKTESVYKIDIDKSTNLVETLQQELNELKRDEVKEFLEHLVFAVNQLHEKDLNEPISELIRECFKISHNKLVSSHFFEVTFDWLKAKENTELNDNFMQSFIEEVKKELKCIENIGVTKNFVENMLSKGIEFEEIENFKAIIENTKNILILKAPKNLTMLGCLAIYQFCDLKNKNDGDYNFINLTSLEWFLRSKILTQNETNLLIVECEKEFELSDESFDSLIALVNKGKKIIFVVPEESQIPVKFSQSAIVNIFETSSESLIKSSQLAPDTITLIKFLSSEFFSKLTDDSKSKLVDCKVDFQTINSSQKPQMLLSGVVAKDFISKSKMVENKVLVNFIEGKIVLGDKNERECYKKELYMPRILRNEKYNQEIECEDIKSFIEREQKRVIVIHNEAGMGKTTEAVHIAQILKETFPLYWILLVDLGSPKWINAFEEKLFINFLKHFLNTNFEKCIFEQLYEEKRVVIIFDAFDEIQNSKKSDIQKKIKNFLCKEKGNQCFITSRINPFEDHRKETKESEDQSRNSQTLDESPIVYKILQFTEEEQKGFLKKYFTTKISANENLKNISEELITNFIDKLLRVWKNSMTEKDLKFLEIPLHTVLLGQAFKEELLASLKDEKIPELPEKLSLFDLFEKFIEEKIKLLSVKEQKVQFLIKRSQESSVNYLVEFYVKIALKQVLGEDVINELNFQFLPQIEYFESPEGCEDVVIEGFVHYSNGEHVFLHRTYAVRFVALRFCEIITEVWEKVNLKKFYELFFNLNNEWNRYYEFEMISVLVNGFLNRVKQDFFIKIPTESFKTTIKEFMKIYFEDFEEKNFIEQNATKFSAKPKNHTLDNRLEAILTFHIKRKNFHIFEFIWNCLVYSLWDSLDKKTHAQVFFSPKNFLLSFRCFEIYEILNSFYKKDDNLNSIKLKLTENPDLIKTGKARLFTEIEKFDSRVVEHIKGWVRILKIDEEDVINQIKNDFKSNYASGHILTDEFEISKFLEMSSKLVVDGVKKLIEHRSDENFNIFFYPIFYGQKENLYILKEEAKKAGIITNEEWQEKIWSIDINNFNPSRSGQYEWLFDEEILSLKFMKKLLINKEEREDSFKRFPLLYNLLKYEEETDIDAIELTFANHLRVFKCKKVTESIKKLKSSFYEDIKRECLLRKIVNNIFDVNKFLLLVYRGEIEIFRIGLSRCYSFNDNFMFYNMKKSFELVSKLNKYFNYEVEENKWNKMLETIENSIQERIVELENSLYDIDEYANITIERLDRIKDDSEVEDEEKDWQDTAEYMFEHSN